MSFCKSLTDFLNKTLPEPDRPDKEAPENDFKAGAKYDRWIDYAKDAPSMKRRGKYKTANGFPDGLIVHYSAGRETGKSLALFAQREGLGFLILDKEGILHQGMPLDQWGYHTGKSSMEYKGKRVTSVSKYCVGVEIICAGMLYGVARGKKLYFTSSAQMEGYTGQLYPWWSFHSNGNLKPNQLPIIKEMVRMVTKKTGNAEMGFYEKYTEAQEQGLVELVTWLQGVNPNFDINLILGHDEVSPGRKQDPGGSFSMTMSEFRSMLKYEEPGITMG